MKDLKEQLFEIVSGAKERGNTVEVDIDENSHLVFYEIERTLIGEFNNEVVDET